MAYIKKMLIGLSLGVFIALSLNAQEQFAPYHYQTYRYDFGTYEKVQKNNDLGNYSLTNEEVDIKISSHTLRIPDAAWLQIHFGKFNLGESSFVEIRSLYDQETQKLFQKHIEEWNRSSAYFNGDALEINLYIHPNDTLVYFSIEQLMVGEFLSKKDQESRLIAESQCGTTDDRVPSNDPAIGRIPGCTGWLISNGAVLTAGHCAPDITNTSIMEFNVPPSMTNGTIVRASPNDQYPIDRNSIEFEEDGDDEKGNDWAVFACRTNANTQLTAHQAQKSFYRISRDASPNVIIITGFGTDTDGKRNRVQQTHSGSYLGETTENNNDIYLKYSVDTEGGNSGSPVIWFGTSVPTAIGIHTDGDCENGSNIGTSFEADDTALAINFFPGNNVRYIDNNHPITTNLSGTITRPYRSVLGGVAASPDNTLLSIAPGAYNETPKFERPMTLTAPAGSVTIGSASSSFILMTDTAREFAIDNQFKRANYSTDKNDLFVIHPNPSNGMTTISFKEVEYEISAQKPAHLFIYNFQGEVVHQQEVASAQEIQINLFGKPKGLYVVKLILDDSIISESKIIYQ